MDPRVARLLLGACPAVSSFVASRKATCTPPMSQGERRVRYNSKDESQASRKEHGDAQAQVLSYSATVERDSDD